MATYHPDLNFAAIYRHANGWCTEDIQLFGESLLPHAKLVAEQVSTQWVMDAHRADMVGSVRQEDVA